MRRLFFIYRNFLGTLLVLGLFISIAGKFGFSYGIDLRLFSRVISLLFGVYVFWEIKRRRMVIRAIIKAVIIKTKDKLTTKIDSKKNSIISLLPSTFRKNKKSYVVTFIATIIALFASLRHLVFQRITLLAFVMVGIFMDIYILDFLSVLIILGLSVLLIATIKFNHLKARVIVSVGLFLLVLCSLLVVSLKKPLMVEKAAIWAYLFLIFGTVYMYFDSFKHED